MLKSETLISPDISFGSKLSRTPDKDWFSIVLAAIMSYIGVTILQNSLITESEGNTKAKSSVLFGVAR